VARLLDWLYARLRMGYLVLYLAADLVSALLVCLGTVGMFALYVDVSGAELGRVLAVAEGCALVSFMWTAARTARLAWPVVAWSARRRDSARAPDAWRAAVELPRRLVAGAGLQPFLGVALPVSLYATWELELAAINALFLFAGGCVAIAYALVLSFFATEIFMRPIVRDVVGHLPPDFTAPPAGVPLRWKLLGAVPIINVITGVVVAGLSDSGRASLEGLGVDVVVAVTVAFTISLELTLLVTNSVLSPVRDLVRATERVAGGDLRTRVPVVSGDELGTLAGSFNSMVRGLEEREALREALGSYVDPDVAERVLREGVSLEGEEVEATVMFVDIRGFTAFADRVSAREAVAYLNDFFGLVVPIVTRHGGHANKFVGDGLLAVFGAPARLSDHADRALSAACEIASVVEETYGERLRIGIGLNSGPVVAGSVGGGGRLEFTVIGDPVNVAARVEEQTREAGESILLTEATRCLLERDDVEPVPCGSVPLRGKPRPTPIYGVRTRERAEPAHKLQTGGRGSRSAREGTKI
jgi:adenylate cyclase